VRIALTTILLIISATVFGQKSLNGKYTHSFFMYEYFLTLADSGKFTIDEHSDLGSKTTTGSWTINEHLVRLTPAKCVLWDQRNPKKENEEIPLSWLEISYISVDSNSNLTKLAPKKQPAWITDTSKYKIPDYKLTKIFKWEKSNPN
jgi:hypothetical protein